MATKKGKKHEREIEKSLSAIYRDEEGGIPDLTTFEPLPSRWRRYALVTLVGFTVIVLAAAWAGFSIFKPFRGFSGQGLALQIEGPEQVALGQETTYVIAYHNQTADPIAAADLRVSFPADFQVEHAEPRPTAEGLTWKLGSLAANGRGTLTIRGTFTGALGTVTAIQVVGTYRPASFSSDLEALSTKLLEYSESVLGGTLSVPVKVLPGDRVSLGYAVENTGSAALENLTARFILPEGFERDATSSGTLLEGRMARIPIGRLAAGASTTVFVTGSFASGVSGEAHVIAETGRAAADGIFLPSQRSETSFSVLAGDLSLKLVLNGQETDRSIAYGSPLRFAVGYENTAPEDLKDVRLHLRFESVSTMSAASLVDWKTVEDSAGGALKGNSMTWTKKQIAALGRLPPHEDGSIDVSVNALRSSTGTRDIAIRVYVEAEIVSVGDTNVNRIVRSAPLVLRYITDADIFAEARFYSEEGVPLGSGPLPPVVGQTTTYRIRWRVAKTVHEIKNLKVKATLPKAVQWGKRGNAEAGEIAYEPNTRSVVWNLNRLPVDVYETTAEFDIEITPGDGDANRFAQLLGETRFEAIDASLNEAITRTHPALTTDLQTDEYAQAKGVVRKP